MNKYKVGDKVKCNFKNPEIAINKFLLGLTYIITEIKGDCYILKTHNLLSEEDMIKQSEDFLSLLGNNKGRYSSSVDSNGVFNIITRKSCLMNRSLESLNKYFIKINNCIYPDE